MKNNMHFWQNPKYRNGLWVVWVLFTLLFAYADMQCHDIMYDMDDDTKLLGWVQEVSFCELAHPGVNRTEVDFVIQFELWNPGPFTIHYQSSTTALGVPYSILMSNNTNVSIIVYTLLQNELGLACDATRISPGVHRYLWDGWIGFNTTISESNPTAPDGNYQFIIGSEVWIAIYPFELTIDQGEVISTINETPEDWGKWTINLGDPLLMIWLGITIGAILITVLVACTKRQKLPILSKKTNSD